MGRAALLFAVLTVAGGAAADPVPVEDPFADHYPRRRPAEIHLNASQWYGWQILAVDSGLLALFATWPAWKFDGTALLTVDAIAYVLAGPIVHGAHGRGPAAGASVALRLGCTMLGGLVGLVGAFGGLASTDAVSAPSSNVAFDSWVGTLGAAGFATLIDSLALAWNRSQGEPRVAWGVVPTIVRGGGALSLSVGY